MGGEAVVEADPQSSSNYTRVYTAARVKGPNLVMGIVALYAVHLRFATFCRCHYLD